MCIVTFSYETQNPTTVTIIITVIILYPWMYIIIIIISQLPPFLVYLSLVSFS